MSNPDDYPTQYLGQIPPQQPQQPQQPQPQAYYTYDQYGNPYLVDQYGNPLPQQPVPPGPPQEPKQSKAVWAVLAGVIVLVLLVIGGVTAWAKGWIGGSTNPTSESTIAADSGQGSQKGNKGQSDQSSGDSSSSESTRKSKTTTQSAPTTSRSSRPTSAPVPNSAIPANAAASDGSVKAGNFEKVWRGTEETSAPFANLVAGEYIEQRARLGRDNVTVTVNSPVTGQDYEMVCLDNGVYVTCTGGNNAVVYIA